jgi:hypothetical protein
MTKPRRSGSDRRALPWGAQIYLAPAEEMIKASAPSVKFFLFLVNPSRLKYFAAAEREEKIRIWAILSLENMLKKWKKSVKLKFFRYGKHDLKKN